MNQRLGMWSHFFSTCLALVTTATATTASWKETIFTLRRQEALTQRLSAEALMIIGAGQEAAQLQRQQLRANVATFDAALLALENGNDQILPPIAAAQQVLQDVSSSWLSLNSTLTSVLEGSFSNVTRTVEAVAVQNLEVYNHLVEMSSIYENADIVANGQNATAATDGRVSLFLRQSTLTYKMYKEVLLISHGLMKSTELMETKTLFTSTHRGIIDGALWLNIPKLTELCALRAMTDVTYYLDQLSVLLTQIAADESQAPAVAAELAGDIRVTSFALSDALNGAAGYLLNTGSCTITELTDLDWFNALTTAQDQLFQASQATKLFLQIALQYDVASSKVQLALLADDATLSLGNLLEGNKANGLVAPPSQSLADEVSKVKSLWEPMREEFTKAIFSDVLSVSAVSEVVRLKKLFTDQMESTVSLYVRTALEGGTQIPAYTIDLASRQRTQAQKLATEASIIHLGYSVEENWRLFNQTAANIMETHWMLLEGAPAKEPYPEVNVTTQICIVQQMWQALGIYEKLEQAAEEVARGDRSLTKLANFTSQFDVEMQVAVEWYKAEGSASCDAFSPSIDQWKGLILEIGRFRRLSQEVSSDFALLELNVSTVDVNKSRTSLRTSAKRLRFGSHLPLVPPPLTQRLLDDLSEQMLPALDSLDEAFEEDDVLAVFNHSSEVLLVAEEFLESFFVRGNADAEDAPLRRMNLASRQIALAQKIFADFVLLSRNASIVTSMAETQASFASAHARLRDGGHGIARLSLVRQDLLKQWERIGNAWSAFSEKVSMLPSLLDDRELMLSNAQDALMILISELEVALPMFGIKDEELRGDILWPIIAYSAAVSCMLLCACAAVYAARRFYAEREVAFEHEMGKV